MAIIWGAIVFGDEPIIDKELMVKAGMLSENESLKEETMVATGNVPEFEQITIFYKGDSITFGKKLPSNMTFAYLVNETLNMWAADNQTSYRFKYVNTAVSGQTSKEAMEEFFEEFDEIKPDLVFLMYGTNDVEIYGGDQRHSVYVNLNRMASHALDSGVKNTIISLPPATTSEKRNEKILPLDLYLEEKFRDKEAVHIFDMYDAVDLNSCNNVRDAYNDTYYLDGLHFNKRGNEAVAHELAALIWNLTKSVPTY